MTHCLAFQNQKLHHMLMLALVVTNPCHLEVANHICYVLIHKGLTKSSSLSLFWNSPQVICSQMSFLQIKTSHEKIELITVLHFSNLFLQLKIDLKYIYINIIMEPTNLRNTGEVWYPHNSIHSLWKYGTKSCCDDQSSWNDLTYMLLPTTQKVKFAKMIR